MFRHSKSHTAVTPYVVVTGGRPQRHSNAFPWWSLLSAEWTETEPICFGEWSELRLGSLFLCSFLTFQTLSVVIWLQCTSATDNQCVSLIVTSGRCLTFTVQNDERADVWHQCRRLFSRSSAEVSFFLFVTLNLSLTHAQRRGFYDITTSLETNRGSICNLHKCEMETWNIKCTYMKPWKMVAWS